MPTTERMKPISLFVPFEPVERRSSKTDPLVVSGYCFVNETVEGEGGIVIERAAMQAATPEYASRGTIREMHGPHAAGRADSVDWDDAGRCHIVARIVDPVAAMKCEEGVYRGFSIKVRPTQRLGNRVKALKWAENSLVDDPADPDCNELTLSRAEGFDPDAEVEVEVLDDPPSPAAAPIEQPVAAAPEPSTSQAIATSSPDPSGEVTPSAGERATESADGASSTEARGDASRLWAMLAPDVPDEMPETERRALVVEHLVSYGVADTIAADMAARVDVMEPVERGQAHKLLGAFGAITAEAVKAGERAQTSSTVPVRENLEGKPKPHHEMVERYVKQKGSQWCVYSESGDELGCHDTHAEAVDQLQAIEANKAKRSSDDGDHEYRAADVEPTTKPETRGPEFWESLRQRGFGPLADFMERFEVLEAEHRKTPAVEETSPAAPETVSRADVREETTDPIQRLQTVEAELARAHTANEEMVTRLAERDRRIAELERMPLDREKPPVRFAAALERQFRANQAEDGADDITAIRRLYQDAQEQAKTETDPRLRDAAVKRVALFQMTLHQLGDRSA